VALLGLLAAAVYVLAIWAVSLAMRNASIIDVFWGPGFAVLTAVYLVVSDGWPARQWLVMALVVMWGLRLGGYIARRNAGKGEDFRYRKWREDSPATFWWRSLFQVFLLQGLLLWIISAPLLAAQYSDEPDSLVVTDILGAAVWAVGFTFESVGDYQLARFKADPANAGKVMRYGLWRYTRHPNYFGDAALWWGFFIIAAGTPWGWATIFAPALMTFLLVRVSGAALLERSLVKRREGYEEYVRNTSGFIPWPPRRTTSAQGDEMKR
jgi:steroid 5-alpha reductase family enzyme